MKNEMETLCDPGGGVALELESNQEARISRAQQPLAPGDN